MSFASISFRPLLLAALGASLLCACKPEPARPASSPAARVDGKAIGLDQVELLAANLPTGDADAVRRVALERLLGEEVLRHEAERRGLADDPKVRARLVAAERQVLASAYLDQVAAATPKPTATEIHYYYAQHPELFAERRIYALREIDVEGGDQVAQAVQDKTAKAKSVAELLEWLRTVRVPFSVKDTTLAAEFLPLGWVGALHALKDGQVALVRGERGVVLLGIAGSRSEPISEEAATPRIEQFLLQQRRAEAMQKAGADLRAHATIEYLPPFAPPATRAAPAAAAKP
ncbi:MAG: EpsD family peptidyl-prolyl cis-trans isomerase [Rhodocyclaceae bacterium]|nr:EpsD family peptidyl-prolyl cis-trans isomerase [Rhodocyclaceae bacterium]MBX3667581.1 EpsD family peptidyl-prolyl cis-trans isomerase [Rhodocyclaceae bacterium]